MMISSSLFVVKLSALAVLCGWNAAMAFAPSTTVRRGALRQRAASASSSSSGLFAWGLKKGPMVFSAAAAAAATKDIKIKNKKKSHNAWDDVLGDLPEGLRQTLMTNASEKFSKRFWIVDNSGSMAVWDGHTALDHDLEHTYQRWDELQETVNCHAQLSAALGAPTDFVFLNPPQQHASDAANNRKSFLGGWNHSSKKKEVQQSFRVGYSGNRRLGRDCDNAQKILAKNKPAGMTALHTRILEIRKEIVQMLPQLQADGMKVAIVIVTDGSNNGDLASKSGAAAERNQELVQALASLEGLPVSVVVRLCTDAGDIVDFYNDLDAGKGLGVECDIENDGDCDSGLHIDIDVLDDHQAEAMEVYRHNPWLNYALILHRMREMGQYHELFNALDERSFTREEIRDFCVLLFGDKAQEAFGPKKNLQEADEWASFAEKVADLQQNEKMHRNPRTNGMAPWINTDELAWVD